MNGYQVRHYSYDSVLRLLFNLSGWHLLMEQSEAECGASHRGFVHGEYCGLVDVASIDQAAVAILWDCASLPQLLETAV